MVKPILFNSDMVRAILEGRKTVTRRGIKPQFKISLEGTEFECRHEKGFWDMGNNEWACRRCGYGVKVITGGSWIHAPYCPGDIMYVRETWHKYEKRVGKGENSHMAEFYGYKASIANSEDASEKWRPSIHMPKEAARIWLRVVSVRLERLQGISNEQIIKEGARQEKINSYIAQMPEKTEVWTNAAYALEWMQIWDSTVKKKDLDTYGWTANPWVWVIEFERCEKPEE